MKQIDKTARIWEPVIMIETNHEIIIGPKCRIGNFCFIGARKFIMEEGAELTPQVTISGGGNVYLGKYSCVNWGARLIPATFTTKGLYMNDAMLQENPKNCDIIRGSITLKEGAVIGSNAVVCVSKHHKDIVIGEHSVVGANCYIDHDVPDRWVVRPIKNLIEMERGTYLS